MGDTLKWDFYYPTWHSHCLLWHRAHLYYLVGPCWLLHSKPLWVQSQSSFFHHWPSLKMNSDLENSPGQTTAVGSRSLLQGIFPTRGSTQVSRVAGGFFTSWATRKACALPPSPRNPPLQKRSGKESACHAGDPSSVPGSRRSSGEGIGYPVQNS